MVGVDLHSPSALVSLTQNRLMIFYIAAYAFIAIATAIAVYDDNSYPVRNKLIGSAVAGAMWPLVLTVQIIVKLVK